MSLRGLLVDPVGPLDDAETTPTRARSRFIRSTRALPTSRRRDVGSRWDANDPLERRGAARRIARKVQEVELRDMGRQPAKLGGEAD
jgi:hypothetical protein